MEKAFLNQTDFFLEYIFKKINKKDFYLFLYAFLLGLLTHFALYSQQLTNPDGLICGFWHGPNDWEFGLGRWGLAVIGLLQSYLVSPGLSTFLSLIILSVTCVLLTNILGIRSLLLKAAVASLLMVCPATSQILTYYYCSYVYFFAFFFAVLASAPCGHLTKKYAASASF